MNVPDKERGVAEEFGEVLDDGVAKVEKMDQIGCIRNNEWKRRAADLLTYELGNGSSKSLKLLIQ